MLDKYKFTTSYEKVEKVVNDPKRPIIRKYFIKLSGIFLYSANEIKYPIKNDPIRFTQNVAKKL